MLHRSLVGQAIPSFTPTPTPAPICESLAPRECASGDMETHGAGLVLTRKRGEQILIRTPEGRLIVITAVGYKSGRQRIGVRVDVDFGVERSEAAPKEWQKSASEVGVKRRKKLIAD